MKKLLVGLLAACAVTVVMAGSASAAVFNHFPNATCTDTMSILTLKTYLNTTTTPCNAATPNTTGGVGDTVLGVGGIVIGFDEIATGYDIYLQMGVGGANTGLDCFTHGTPLRGTYGLNLGDSVVVEYACVANYFGDIEVEAPNNLFSAPNIVLRKVGSGYALPPSFHGNTTDFKETPTNTLFKSHISELVTLDGPVRVARVGAPAGDNALGFHGALVVRDAAPSDSVFIDYNKLTVPALLPPAVGTYLTSVSGISNASSRGYRIMPRSADDIIDAVAPGVSDAYAIADNQYRVVFDRSVTAGSATSIPNYSLGSFGTINSIVTDGANAVILNVTTALLHGDAESVTINGVTGQANGVSMTSPVTLNFIAGVLSVGEMSQPSPDSLALIPCVDKSRFAGAFGDFTNGQFGPRSTVTGIVTGIFGNLYYMQDAGEPALPHMQADHRGITVFAPPVALTLGHRYVIAGADEEYYKENEFAAITYVSDQGAATVDAPISLSVGLASYDTCDAQRNIQDGRDYLSLLVKLERVTVVQRFETLPTNGFHVAGAALGGGGVGTDTIFIENQNTVLGPNATGTYPAVGTVVDVVGLSHYTTNTSTPSLRVCPRSQADITVRAAGVGAATSNGLSFSVYPNPARTAHIAFSLPKASNVKLGVYDLLGRQVAHIADGALPAGSYQKSWSGLDDSGNKVHAGVYFYRLTAGGETRTARTLLLGN